MKLTSKTIKNCILILGTAVLAGCSQHGGNPSGSSSGGGGYVWKNSKVILEMAQKDLRQQVSFSSASLYSKLPEG